MKAILGRPTLGMISRIYLMLALVAAMLLSALPCSAIAMALFLLQVYLLWKKPSPKVSLPLNLLCLVAFPLVFESTISQPFAAFLVLPAIPLLDGELKGNAQTQHFASFTEGRKASTVLKGITLFLAVVLFASLMVANYTLSFTVALLEAYILVVSLYTMRRLSGPLCCEENAHLKVIAGESRAFSTILRNRSEMPLRLRISSIYPWVCLASSEFRIAETLNIETSVTPPLAGPASLSFQTSVLDPRGLLQVNRVMELAELTVIPRARYAGWLARRYLEEGAGALRGTMVSPSLASLLQHKGRGVEYHSSRHYSPGDSLKNIDWKHTAKLRELVVKEYLDIPGQMALVVVNLAAEDAEEADKMAYSLLTSVLALAISSIPVALAAYNHREVVEATPAMAAKVMLKKVLQLIEGTVWIEPMVRFLQPPDLKRLRRTQERLEGAGTEPARKLADILRVEREAVQRAVAEHPATLALQQVTSSVAPPAMILVISSYNHDAEALPVTLARLQDRGYRAMPVYVKGG